MRKTISILLFSLLSQGASAQHDWELKKDDDGIKVFTSNIPGSCFKAIKVECSIKATQSQLVAYLLDINRQHDWVYGNKSSTLIKKVAPNEEIFYSEVSVPWPCTNRDYIAHFTINQVSPQLMTIDSRAEPDLLPLKEGRVRVKSSVAHWEVSTINNDLLNIVYTVQFDPGGAVPAWLTNMFVTKGPWGTFQKLREGVCKCASQYAHVDFIKE